MLQPAEGRGRLRSTRPAADSHTYPNLPAFQFLRHLLPGLLALRPQRVLLDLLKTLQQADARPTSTHDIRVTLSEGIDLAELKRIHPKLLAKLLHRRFQGKVGLRTSGCAIGAGTGLVGLHHVATDVQVGTAIDASEMEAAKAGKKIGVSSRIKNHPGLDSSERAVSLSAEFDGDHRLWRGVACQQIFLARVDQSYRLAQAGCHCCYQRFKQGLFPSKSATDGHRLDTDLPLRHLQRRGDCRAHIEQALCAGPDHQVMARVAWRYGNRLRLHIGLMDRVGAIGAFDHHLGLAQTSLDITHLHGWCLADILRKSLFLGRCTHLRGGSVLTSSGGCFGLTARANQGRIWSYGSLGINDDRQRIVIDLHSVGSIFSASLRLADHDGHRMPTPHHFLLCQWGLRAGERIRLGHSQRIGGKNRHDSWQRQGSRCIDVQDACMGVRARDQTRSQHTWRRLISCVARPPGHFVRSVLAGERRANCFAHSRFVVYH